MYTLGQYLNPETNRHVWGAYHGPTATWYFPKRYGKHEANCLVRRLNKEI